MKPTTERTMASIDPDRPRAIPLRPEERQALHALRFLVRTGLIGPEDDDLAERLRPPRPS